MFANDAATLKAAQRIENAAERMEISSVERKVIAANIPQWICKGIMS